MSLLEEIIAAEAAEHALRQDLLARPEHQAEIALLEATACRLQAAGFVTHPQTLFETQSFASEKKVQFFLHVGIHKAHYGQGIRELKRQLEGLTNSGDNAMLYTKGGATITLVPYTPYLHGWEPTDKGEEG